MPQPVNVWNVGAELGEGPVWVERDSALWFTDIKQRKVHRYEPATGAKSSWDSPEQVGFVFPARSGGFVAGLESGLFRFDPGTGGFEPIVEVDAGHPANRLNDGVVDASGRLWFGTMDDSERGRSGSFYRFESGRVIPTGLSGIAITNGPAVSPDGRILYWVDTVRGTISACDIGDDGTLGPSRRFASIERGGGHPDGPTVDKEGCVWISLYAGWQARRYSPAGEIVGRIGFPTANITKIAFGGPDLATIYVTTAKHLLSAEERGRQPEAGDLFEVRGDVRGLPCQLVDF